MKHIFILSHFLLILSVHLFGQNNSVKSIKKRNIDNSVQKEDSHNKQTIEDSDCARVKIQVPHLFNNLQTPPQHPKGNGSVNKVVNNESKPPYPKNKSRQINVRTFQE